MSDLQSRIINHMNKDHKLAIEDYLAVYGDVIVNDKIANVKLKSIDLDHMEISFNHFDVEFEIVKPIPIDPPMKDLTELRVKLVDMAKYAAKKRGFSHVQIQDMVYPTKIVEYSILFLIILMSAGYLYPTIVYNYFLDHILSLSVASFLQRHNKTIFLITLITHLIEAYFVLLPKLNFYRVPTDFKIEWILFCLVDGAFTINRFKNLTNFENKH